MFDFTLTFLFSGHIGTGVRYFFENRSKICEISGSHGGEYEVKSFGL
jgi:hypothetical protein